MNEYGQYHLLLMRVPSRHAPDDSLIFLGSDKPVHSDRSPSRRGAAQESSPRSAVPSPPQSKAGEPARPQLGSPATPLHCSHIFCDQPASNGDLCEAHADQMADLREEYYDLQREFEGGW